MFIKSTLFQFIYFFLLFFLNSDCSCLIQILHYFLNFLGWRNILAALRLWMLRKHRFGSVSCLECRQENYSVGPESGHKSDRGKRHWYPHPETRVQRICHLWAHIWLPVCFTECQARRWVCLDAPCDCRGRVTCLSVPSASDGACCDRGWKPVSSCVAV